MQPLTKKDLTLAAIIGLIVAGVLLVVSENIDLTLPYGKLLLLALPVLSAIGLWIAWLLGRANAFFFQFGKFALVGALNTFVDLGVLNLFIFFTAISTGIGFSLFKGVAFLVAVINSYYWNKIWTFHARKGGFTPFLIVSLIGFFINVGVATLVVNAIGPLGGISAPLWANIGAIVATGASLVWNFIGYKKFVFKP